jgi:hypothetical protein
MRARLVAAILILSALPATNAFAWSEPPIKDARDAACRDEARSKVFTAPDPEGKGLFETGRRLYQACMASAPRKGRNLVAAGN